MKKIIIKTVSCLILAAVLLTACGGRLPKTKSSENTIERYFHRYGHKYKGSDFTIYKIESVRVIDAQEIHKGLVAIMAEVKLIGGPTYMVRCTMEKKTFRWKLMSWERMS